MNKNTKHIRKSKARRQAKSAVPGLNVALLRKVKRHILEEPRRFAMGFFLEKKADYGKTYLGDDNKPHSFAKCGTAACIAGWATILAKGDENYADGYTGSDALNINASIAHRLFFEGSWPHKFRNKYEDCKSVTKRAKIAANRIEHFIKTGE